MYCVNIDQAAEMLRLILVYTVCKGQREHLPMDGLVFLLTRDLPFLLIQTLSDDSAADEY